MGTRLSLPWHHLWALMPQNSPFKSVGLFGNSVVAFWLLLPTGQPWPKGLCWDLEPLQSLGSCSWCLWPAKATLLPCPAAGSLGLQPGVNIARAQHLSTQLRTALRGDPGPQAPGDHGHWGHSLWHRQLPSLRDRRAPAGPPGWGSSAGSVQGFAPGSRTHTRTDPGVVPASCKYVYPAERKLLLLWNST